MKEDQILFAGLHSTGKTTFIAALWYYVTQGDHRNPLTLNSLEKGDQEYLNKIREKWAQFSLVGRTSGTNPIGQEVIMNLKRTSDQSIISLKIPDFSGETFNSHFENRGWSKEYDEMIEQISGIVLFVNATDANNCPSLIVHANQIERDLVEINGAGVNEANSSLNEEYDKKKGDTVKVDIKIQEWNHKFVPNQVKLVDLLQFMDYHKPHKLPLRISVTISSWDRVVEAFGEEKTPEEWLKGNMPLLAQYLDSNSEMFSTKCFGISAQGVDYSNEEKVNELADLNPLDRIFVIDEKGKSTDITRPILWITE